MSIEKQPSAAIDAEGDASMGLPHACAERFPARDEDLDFPSTSGSAVKNKHKQDRLPADGREDAGENIQMTKYQVLLNNAGPLEIEADKVNLGVSKLWFYDNEEHLLALFPWDQVIGFQVIGSTQDQAFTNDLLHDKTPKADEPAEPESKKGLFLTTAQELRENLHQMNEQLSFAWLKLRNSRNSAETALMIESHAAELRLLQAQILDERKSMDQAMRFIVDEFKDI